MHNSHILFISFSGRFGGSERDTLRRASYFSELGYKVSYFFNHKDILQNTLNYEKVNPVFIDSNERKYFEKKLKEFLSDNQVTHIHNSTVSLYFYVSRLQKKYNIKRASFFFGGSDITHINLKRLYALNIINSIIVNSPTAKKNIEKYLFFNKDKIHLILNMISAPHHSESYRKYLRLEEKVVIGFCGGLNGHKGADYLIPTLAHLRKFTSKKFHLLMAGDGIMKELIEKQAKEEGLENDITFLGHINDLSKFYNSVDIFLLSSRDEGMANVLFEAMVHKCKIVSTNVNGVEYALNNGERGIIVPPNDPLAMAKALNEVINKEFSPNYLDNLQKEILAEYNEKNFYENSFNAIV